MNIQYSLSDTKQKIKMKWNSEHRQTIIKDEKEIYPFNKRDHCYHYTSLDSFWKIVENDTFRATHVRFSNDSQEYKIGERVVGEILGNKETGNVDSMNKNFFAVCFCERGDLLSQWREYGKTGVSIEMDFRRQSVFTIHSAVEKKRGSADKLVYSYPLDVLYVNDKTPPMFYICNENIDSEVLSTAFSNYSAKDQMYSLIPYIKHYAFVEEKESRLLFLLSEEENLVKNYIFYSDPNQTLYRKPFLEVSYGDKKTEQYCKDVYILKSQKKVVAVIEKWVEEYNLENPIRKLNIRYISEHYEDLGSTTYISEGNNQKEIFLGLDAACSELGVKIWCDGHWPIRSIMVGPNLDKDLIKESIDHYCKSKYWLKYVNVVTTDTPYREKRG